MRYDAMTDQLNEAELAERFRQDMSIKIDHALPLMMVCEALATAGLVFYHDPYKNELYIMRAARAKALRDAVRAQEAARHRMLERGVD